MKKVKIRSLDKITKKIRHDYIKTGTGFETDRIVM